jgi:anti-sigma-K factor RskA
MSAPTQTPPHPATRAGTDSRLPWWALALPALAFTALLVLILNPSDAHAATGDPMVTHLFERMRQLIAR